MADRSGRVALTAAIPTRATEVPAGAASPVPARPVPMAGLAATLGDLPVPDRGSDRTRRSVVQLRALVGAADDPAEIEAERVAQSVVRRLRAGGAGTAVTVRRRGNGLANLRRARGEPQIGPGGGEVGVSEDHLLRSRAGSGSPIPEQDRGRLEDAFGADLSAVRLHTDTDAAALNRTMGASAFTYGRDIYFRDGAPDTRAESGLNLLAHELTHTLQQGAVRRRAESPGSDAAAAPVVRRSISVVDRNGGAADLLTVLDRLGIRSNKDRRRWYTTSISGVPGRLRSRYGYDRFAGFLGPRNDMTIRVAASTDAVTFDDLNTAVASAINARLVAVGLDRGHSTIGSITLMKRTGFPTAVKASFDKAEVIRQIGKEGGPHLASREVHLRHLVMGSWFRALPTMIAEAELSDPERADLAKRVAALVPRVAPLAGEPGIGSANDLAQDSQVLALLLHNLLPNLNAGEGPENVLIGFMSHGLSNLAEDIRTGGQAIGREDAAELIGQAVARVTLVAPQYRDAFVNQLRPTEAFLAILEDYVADDVPGIEPDLLAAALHEFAYNLGMDLLKREEGRATTMQGLALAQAQQALLPVGDTLYSMIRVAQLGRLDIVQLDKLCNTIEQAVSLIAGAQAQPKNPLPPLPKPPSGGPGATGPAPQSPSDDDDPMDIEH